MALVIGVILVARAPVLSSLRTVRPGAAAPEPAAPQPARTRRCPQPGCLPPRCPPRRSWRRPGRGWSGSRAGSARAGHGAVRGPRRGTAHPPAAVAGLSHGPAGEAGQPDWLEPELATLTQERFSDSGWLFERKLDGERCLAFRSADSIRLMTRNQKEVANNYPEIAGALRRAGLRRLHRGRRDRRLRWQRDPASRLLQQRIHVTHPDARLLRKVPVFYYIFDVLYADDQDVRPQPLRERKDVLHRVLSFRDPLRFTEHRDTEGEASTPRPGQRLGGADRQARRRPVPGQAEPGLAEVQVRTNQEFVIGGYTDPQRLPDRVRRPAARLLRRRRQAGLRGQGRHRFRHQDPAAACWPSWRSSGRTRRRSTTATCPGPACTGCEPQLVAQIGFSEWTRDGQLRHPRFQGLRRDKAATEVVREVPT